MIDQIYIQGTFKQSHRKAYIRSADISMKRIQQVIIFIIPTYLVFIQHGLANTFTWEQLVERNKVYFEKFKDTPFKGTITIYWGNGH